LLCLAAARADHLLGSTRGAARQYAVLSTPAMLRVPPPIGEGRCWFL